MSGVSRTGTTPPAWIAPSTVHSVCWKRNASSRGGNNLSCSLLHDAKQAHFFNVPRTHTTMCLLIPDSFRERLGSCPQFEAQVLEQTECATSTVRNTHGGSTGWSTCLKPLFFSHRVVLGVHGHSCSSRRLPFSSQLPFSKTPLSVLKAWV